MTLGTSLILIAIVGALIYGAKKLSKHKKWKLAGMIFGGLIALCVLIGLSIWAWYVYQDRPQKMMTLGKVSLGMSPLDVSLALGKADEEIAPDDNDSSRYYEYKDYSENLEYLVRFTPKNETPSEVADIICSEDYSKDIFGLGKYDSENDVMKKLGEPSSQSIRSDGLAKFISYEKWNASFEVEAGEITRACISSSGKVSYLNEYETVRNDNEVLDLANSPISSTSKVPTITGTYSGDTGVAVAFFKDGQKVLSGASDHGGSVEVSNPGEASGRFTYKASQELSPGEYRVEVYVFHNIYTDQGYVGDSEMKLTNYGTIIVK